MSIIPGNVGTTPVQNIGAYGAEIKDTFVSCDAMNIETQEIKTFTKVNAILVTEKVFFLSMKPKTNLSLVWLF